MTTLSERNTIALQADTEWRLAYADAGFLVFPEMIQAENDPPGLGAVWIVMLCAFAFIMGVCAGMALA